MGISLGLVGLGGFGSVFANLFKNHPLVDRIAVCDREPDRVKRFLNKEDWRDKLHPRDGYSSMEEICKIDLDALMIFTQPWLHAPQCVQAMESGKHVYSAVPVVTLPDGQETLDWCNRLVETSRRTGMFYMLGETTYYYPQTMFCRRKAAEGAFGDFIFAEGQYLHDLDSCGCSLRDVIKTRLTGKAGREWLQWSRKYFEKGILESPMHYPTHSTSGPVIVMKAHAVKVNAYGYRNRNKDPFFADFAFSNETALFKMSNNATVRICEFREVAAEIPESEMFRIFGTRGSFAENRWQENFRDAPMTAKPLAIKKMTDDEMRDPLPAEVRAAFFKTSEDLTLYGSHQGSHPFLVHEFIDAVAHQRQPKINIWEAVRYMAMGVMAHMSALRDGETLDVPDWGDAPA